MVHRMSRLFVKEKSFYRLILSIAVPVVLQNMITIGVNIMDTMMLGSYGEIQLSASSLANEFINIYHIMCMGMSMGSFSRQMLMTVNWIPSMVKLSRKSRYFIFSCLRVVVSKIHCISSSPCVNGISSNGHSLLAKTIFDRTTYRS